MRRLRRRGVACYGVVFAQFFFATSSSEFLGREIDIFTSSLERQGFRFTFQEIPTYPSQKPSYFVIYISLNIFATNSLIYKDAVHVLS